MPSQEFSSRKGSIWERTVFEGKSFPELREEMDGRVMAELKHYDDVSWEPGSAGPLSGKWARPAAPNGKLMYYIHGGGFTLGSSGIAMPFLMELSHRLGITCFSCDYRLAPEHTFPAAPEDAFAGYRGLLELGYAPEDIVICGESAGATLSLDIPLMAREAGIPAPAAVVALSPVTDATVKSDKKVLEGLDSGDRLYQIYAPGYSKDHPLISPAFGDLTDYPAVFLCEGTAEALAGQCGIFAKKAAAAGCQVQMLVGKDMIHTYPLDLWDYPEAMEAFETIELFVRQQLRIS